MKKTLIWVAAMAVVMGTSAWVYGQAQAGPMTRPGAGGPQVAPAQNPTPGQMGQRGQAQRPFREFMMRREMMRRMGPMAPTGPTPSVAAPAPAGCSCPMMATAPAAAAPADSGEKRPWEHGRMHWKVCLLAFGALAVLAVAAVIITLFWILPITIGLRIARRKHLSGLWMLFGIHPLGGWITCIVLALCTPRVECASCGGYVKANFKQCPYCRGAVEKGR